MKPNQSRTFGDSQPVVLGEAAVTSNMRAFAVLHNQTVGRPSHTLPATDPVGSFVFNTKTPSAIFSVSFAQVTLTARVMATSYSSVHQQAKKRKESTTPFSINH